MASKASNLAGFVTSISPVNNLTVGIVTASSINVGSAVTLNSGGINVAGVVTATSFVGNGSGLTGAGSTVADDTVTNGTFYPVFTQTTSGTITASKVSTTKLSFNPSTGTLSASNVSIAGTLTYEDVTNVDSVGLITARSGIRLTGGDATLGTGVTVSGSTANTFTVSTNGSERVRVDSSGNLGIGNPTPGATLDVSGDIRLSAGDPEIEFNNGGSRLRGHANALSIHTGGGFGSSASELVRINNTGVGIGTTNPSGIGGQTSQLTLVGSNAGGGAGYHQFLTVSNTTATNPAKFFRLNSTGGIEIVNNAYTATILTLDNSGNLAATGNVTAYSSDQRLKENIKNLENPLEKILQLNGCTFDWNEKSKELGFTPKHETNDIGLLAQEVEKVLPQAVAPAPFDREINEFGENVSKSGENYLTIQYERLVPLLIEAIKEQQEQIKNQQEQIDALRAQMESK